MAEQQKWIVGAVAAAAALGVGYYIYSTSAASSSKSAVKKPASGSSSEAKPAPAPQAPAEAEVAAAPKPARTEKPAAASPSTPSGAAAALGWPASGTVPVIQYECVHRSAGELAPVTTRRPDEGFLSFEMRWRAHPADAARLLVEWTAFRMESDPDASAAADITQRIVVAADGGFAGVDNLAELVDIATTTAVGGLGEETDAARQAMMEAQFEQIRPVIREQITNELRATWESIAGKAFEGQSDVAEGPAEDADRQAWGEVLANTPGDSSAAGDSNTAAGLFRRVWVAHTEAAQLKEMVRQSLAQVFGGVPPPPQMLDFKEATDRVTVTALTLREDGRARRVEFLKKHALKFTCNGESVSRVEYIARKFLVLWGRSKGDADVQTLIKREYESFIEMGDNLLAEADAH